MILTGPSPKSDVVGLPILSIKIIHIWALCLLFLNFFIFLKNKKNMKNIQKKKKIVSSFFILKKSNSDNTNLRELEILLENTKMILKNYFQ